MASSASGYACFQQQLAQCGDRTAHAEVDCSRCRSWRTVLSDCAVELVFPYWLTPAQRGWCRRATVAVRGVRFADPADQLCDPAADAAVQALAARQPSIIEALQVHLFCWRPPSGCPEVALPACSPTDTPARWACPVLTPSSSTSCAYCVSGFDVHSNFGFGCNRLLP